MTSIDWLLESDPAIRWQALRDLTPASPAVIAAERARVVHERLGAEILKAQHSDGAWRKEGSPTWLSTLFTMLLLRATGIDPESLEVRTAIARPLANLKWNDHGGCWDLRSAELGGNSFFDGEEEPCINGGVLAMGSYFGHPSTALAERLLSEQLEDGGWNCEAPDSSRSSYHTTICVLEGLLEYERATGGSEEVLKARRRGEEYLLERSLFRRRSTGEIASNAFLELAFPPRYRYDILRALDYFRASGARPDERMDEAIQVIESKKQENDRWLLDQKYDESIPVRLEEEIGQPSRWNTLRALRVLRWYRK